MKRAVIAALAALAACGDDGAPAIPDAPPDASIVGMPGTWHVAGTARFEDRPQLESGSLGDPVAKPARGITIAIVRDADGMTLAQGMTDDTGAFALDYDALGGDMVHLLMVPLSELPERPITVARPSGLPSGFGGKAFAAGLDTEEDILSTVASHTAQSFNVFDEAVGVMDAIRTVYGHATPTPLTLYYAPGSQDGTYYDQHAIHLLGDPSDDDGFDDTVIRHECGHFVEDTEGRTDSPGGAHGGSPVTPTLAWSEGFSTYFAMAIGGRPLYIDTNASGGWSYNADTTITNAPQPAGMQTQNVSEDMVTEVLWDLGDGGTGDDDAIDGTHAAVLVVQQAYLKTSVLRDDVSVVGVDLVDWLDGWFVAGTLDSCDGARGVVQTTRKFPYDFAGPAGICP